MKQIKKIIVHSGTFHADDVMCVAIMKSLYPGIQIERVSGSPKSVEDDVIIADIGQGRYDHHQKDAMLREDGKKYAACGLIYRDFGRQLFLTEEWYKDFRRKYIIPIEDSDNGGQGNPLSEMIMTYNPCWDDDMSLADKRFLEAVGVFLQLVKREQKMEQAELRANPLIDSYIKNSVNREIVIMEKFVPWQENVCKTDAQFVIYPNFRGGYVLRSVPVVENSGELRVPVLAKENMRGCTFAHVNRFLAIFQTQEQAVDAANYILESISEN